MNPNIQQVQSADQIQGLLSAWAGAEVLSGLIHRRRSELRLERAQSQSTTTSSQTEIDDTEMRELARDAARGSLYFVEEYFNVSREQTSQTQQTQQRRTA